jgi:hypothetical protein
MMTLVPYEYTAENADRAARGEFTVYWNGRAVSRRLRKAELQVYERAKVQHFVVARDIEVSNAYFRWCEGSSIPFIKVLPKVKFAAVSMDFISMPGVRRKDLDETLTNAVETLWQREGQRGSRIYVGFFSSCSRVPLARAEAVAAELWDLSLAWTQRRTLQPSG